MRFYSTNHKSPLLSLKEVLLKGQAPDRGLYMPETIPTIPIDVINSFSNLEYSDIAYLVTNYFLESSLPSEEIKKNYPGCL